MLCKSPYRPPGDSGIEFDCGRCMPCRINRRRVLTCRCLLESLSHPVSGFVTLTYDEEHCPSDGAVNKKEAQLFLKRLRSRFGPFRYLMVGEYGSRSFRPHYHALLFGLSPAPEELTATWARGHVQSGSVNAASVAYCCGYTVKKMTQADDPRLQGRAPEFRLMSMRPGLGSAYLDQLEELHQTQAGAEYLCSHRDVFRTIRLGGRLYPLGSYMTRKLRERLGLPASDGERRSIQLAEAAGRGALDLDAMRERRKQSGRNAKARVRLARERSSL